LRRDGRALRCGARRGRAAVGAGFSAERELPLVRQGRSLRLLRRAAGRHDDLPAGRHPAVPPTTKRNHACRTWCRHRRRDERRANAMSEAAVMPTHPPAVADGDAIVEVTEVTLRFGGVTSLADVTLNQLRGEILSVIGPNGAGKTSLFNCLS